MLPASKSDFPKLLYLDQNKWIDLGRAHYQRDGGEEFKPALQAVRDAIHAGNVVVPMSGVHVMETMAPKDEDRRRRLAEFMVDLSSNRSLVPHMSVRELEILQAVVGKLGGTPATSVRTGIIHEGLSYALGAEPVISGVPAEAVTSLTQMLRSPEVSVKLLVDAADDATRIRSRQDDEAAVLQLEEIRRRAANDLTWEMKHRVELADLFTKGEPGAELRRILVGLGIRPSAFFAQFGANNPEEYIAFFHSVPTVDVFVTLGLERDRDLNRPIHRNDAKDMAFLSIALPYANFIVTEKFWGHVSNVSGLASRYATVVSTDARDLPQLLSDHGCLP